VESTVLIVDDSETFLDAARLLLERQGLKVAGVASTSAEALRQADAIRPDVVLVDVFLGKESGFQLARQLVERNQDRQTTVILISSYDRQEFEDLLGSSAAAGFLSKAELSARAIRLIVERRRQLEG